MLDSMGGRRNRLLFGAAGVAIAICLAAMAGWLWGFPRLTRFLPELPTMKFNGALAFVALALAILAAQVGWRRRAALALTTAGALALATLAQYVAGIDLGLDQWLVADTSGRAGEQPGRMALSTLACLLALCGGLALRLVRPQAARLRVASRLTAVALGVAYVGSMGLLTQTRWDGPMAPIFGAFSLPTAAVILLLGIASLELGVVRAAAPEADLGGAGRNYARVALPLGLLIPVSAAWASTVVGNPLGWPASTSPAVALAATGILFAWLVMGSAGWIAQLEGALRWERQALEVRVQERTAQWQAAQQGEAQARQQLDAIVDSADVAIVALDPQARVRMYNPAAERMFGRAARSVLGGPMELLMPPEVRLAHARWAATAAAGAEPSLPAGQGMTVDARRADGGEFPAEAVVSALPGRPPLLAVVLRDLSAAHALEKERLSHGRAEAVHRARIDLMAKISHELRTPLNAILGFSQLLTATPAVRGDARALRFVELIRDAGQSLLTLANDLSDLNRIETGRWRLDLRAVDLAAAVQRGVDLVRTQAQAAGVTCALATVAPEMPAVRADESRLRQILLNLLSNAIKYNHRGGAVTVAVEPLDDQHVAVRVSDTGLGLTEAQQARVFEAYERAGREGSEIPGQGLGLAIARELARAMGGDLTVQSRPGEGSVFTLSLRRHA